MKKILLPLLAVMVVFIFLADVSVFAAEIMNIRHWTAPDHTRIVVDTSAEALFDVKEEQGKITIDFADTVLGPEAAAEYVLDKPAVSRVCVVSLPGNRIRIEVFTAAAVKPTIFTLGRILEKPHRVVIDVNIPEVEERESVERKKVKILEKKKVVVIDPGHGGEDPGAIGRRGTREKDIVLKISKVLRDMLMQRGYKVLLTREGDYYVSFKKRLQIARDCNADLFLSIHADACPKGSVKGASVYCLSTGGASSEAARILAASQNLSDIIGGVPNGQNNDETDPVILNMLQTETLNQARSFGMTALSNIRRVNQLKFATVQDAPFRVLKLPEVTSVLIETAYLSNTNEEMLLKSGAYQNDIAWAIAAAVTEYLPSSSVIEFVEKDRVYEPLSKKMLLEHAPVFYLVKKGDRLEEIAERFDTTVVKLMKENNLKSKNVIYAGQKLIIDRGRISPSSETVHVVKRGETLISIARSYGSTVEAIMNLNNIPSQNRIYVGQKLKLIESPSEKKVVRKDESSRTPYVVKRGDRLVDIANKFGVTIDDLMKLNDLKSKDRIYVGQVLSLGQAEPADAGDRDGVSSKQESRVQATGSRGINKKIYVVKRGDCLDEIAKQCGGTAEDLMKMNKLKSKDLIYAGQKLAIADNCADGAIPVQSKKREIYVVRKGDTVETIARRFGTTAEELVSSNSLKSKNLIFAGQQLNIPVN